MSKCKLIVFSDIHYLDERPKKLNAKLKRKLTQYAEEIVMKLIDEIHDTKPDLSICLGDLIEDTYNHDKDIANYTYIWNILKKIPVPFYSALGNHDLRTMYSRKEIEEIMGYENATFSFNMNGYHFIILTTDIKRDVGEQDGGIYQAQHMSEEEISWLKEDLLKNTLPCIIFTHFGLAEDRQIGNYWFQEYPENALMAIGSLTENIDMQGHPDGVYLEIALENREIHVIEKHIKLVTE